jgi:hypothetical protein
VYFFSTIKSKRKSVSCGGGSLCSLARMEIAWSDKRSISCRRILARAIQMVQSASRERLKVAVEL